MDPLLLCAYCFKDKPRWSMFEFANGSLIECDECWLEFFCILPWWKVSP